MMSTTMPSAHRSEIDREMLIELLGLHAKSMLRMPWVQAALVLGMGLLIYPHVSGVLLSSWAVLCIGVEMLRARYAAGVLRRGSDINPKRVHAAFVGLAALAGIAIAVGVVMFLPRVPIWGQLAFGTTVVGIASAGVAVSQSSRYIVGAYATSILVPGATVWCLVYPSQAPAVAVLIGVMLVVLVLVAADGEKLLSRSVDIRHERDRLVRDLERKNAEVRDAMAQAAQSAQARSRVLAAASHDLRQPLQALSVYSAVLGSGPAPDLLEEVSGNIDQIVRALGNLLNGLLDLSRLSAGYYLPECRNLSLEVLVAGVCTEYQQPAAQKGLSLSLELTPIRVLGDPVAIERIARNLIDNAIKYTECGEVRVATHTEIVDGTAQAVLSVSDTGKGIPASEHSRIFEEFYQLDNPGRDRNKGVGLGLAIVQRLCELVGAKIGVRSVEGHGTCFRVSMPALLGTTEAPHDAPTRATESSLQGRRVYVIDDEPDILKSMRTLFGVWGISALTAESSTAADSLFEQHGVPDMLIVDLRLSQGEHGAGLADRLQQLHGAFPVLVITGETSSQALRHANESGYSLLQKPIAPEVLRRTIVAVLSGV
jgi:signal transduction histidine kinase